MLKRTYSVTAPASAAKRRKYNPPAKKYNKTADRFSVKSVPPELKNYDITFTNYNCASDAFPITLCNPITAGTGTATMVGRKVLQKSLTFDYVLTNLPKTGAAITTLQPVSVRVFVVYDKDPNAATPVITDIITGSSIVALQNLNNTQRFLILSDKMHDLGFNAVYTTFATAAVCGGPNTATCKVYKKFSLPFTGPSTAGAIAGITEGAIFMFAIANTTDSQSDVLLNGYMRVRYVDN